MSVDHLDLVVTSLERSLAFYRDLLQPLGYVRLSEIAGERGELVHRPSERDLAAQVRLLTERLERLELERG